MRYKTRLRCCVSFPRSRYRFPTRCQSESSFSTIFLYMESGKTKAKSGKVRETIQKTICRELMQKEHIVIHEMKSNAFSVCILVEWFMTADCSPTSSTRLGGSRVPTKWRPLSIQKRYFPQSSTTLHGPVHLNYLQCFSEGARTRMAGSPHLPPNPCSSAESRNASPCQDFPRELNG